MTRSENERGERADCTKKKSLAWEDGWMGREKKRKLRPGENAGCLNLLRSSARLLLAGRLGWEQLLVNGRKDTTLGNGDTREELVEFFVVSDGELEVTRDDTGFCCGGDLVSVGVVGTNTGQEGHDTHSCCP
jgi:hypothetical protein